MFNNSMNNWIFSQIDGLVSQYFTVTSVSYRALGPQNQPFPVQAIPSYEVLRRSDLSENMEAVSSQLQKIGYVPILRSHPTEKSRGVLYIFPHTDKRLVTGQNWKTPLILFALTVLSVFFVGLMLWNFLRQVNPSLSPIETGLFYTVGLIGIVGIHELGHMVASRLHGIKASFPYFLPIPFGYGTFGAFITQKTPTKSRNDLFDVGLAGPLFGFVPALIFSVLGLVLSTVIPLTEVPIQLLEDPLALDFRLFSESRFRILLFELLAFIILPTSQSGVEVFLNPLAIAGYIGFLLTGLNLIPIGQLDGGHVARALFDERHHKTLTYISAGFMVILGFWFFALLIIMFYSQTGHAGPLDDVSQVSSGRKIIAILSIGLAILCLPVPSELFQMVFPFLG
ncbi:MAG: site-2 protease family protein [Candidatus Thorarchaeota archaeon]